jgi:thioesterase domain-containing protein
MRLVDLIRHQTGADIGVTSVFLHPTPRRLAAALESSIGSAGNPLVELAGQDGPPLFLVHAIEGTVTAYIPLAQELAGTFEVLGLESPALSDPAAIAASLDDLVTDYTRRIRAVQPAGPYALGGWSMGGVIAFEVARRLEQAGADVDLLLLLDAPFALPADLPRQEELAGRFVADAAHSLGLEAEGAPDPVTTPPAGQLAWLAAQLTGGDIEAQLQRRFDVFVAHQRLIGGYQPSAPLLRAPTLIVSATRSLNAPAPAHWREQLHGEVSVLPVDSDHYAFLRPPMIGAVGAAIRRWYRREDSDALRA